MPIFINPATICDSSTAGGFSDWYLPSYDKLELIRTNIGLPINTYLWSSSQKSNNEAWSKNLGNPTELGILINLWIPLFLLD